MNKQNSEFRTQNAVDKKPKKVAVGMSGGVDSSLTAAMLVEQGYEVVGVFLECWRAPGCRVEEDRKDALDVALKLGIPFKVLDFKKEYKERVVEYFYREYEAGRTPNPDTMCNREIKFGMFYDWAMEEGFDYVATGHYARVLELEEAPNGKHQASNNIKNQKSKFKNTDQNSKIFALGAGKDVKKDQSYFLYQLRPEQLEHVMFPLGEMTKKEVRAEAKKRDLVTADKPDSVGICFIGDIDVRAFLEERIEPKKGDVVVVSCRSLVVGHEHDESCYRVVGEHDGAWFYTIGQRSGFTVKQNLLDESGKVVEMIPPFYVIEKDVEKNRLVVGFGEETLRDEFEVEEVNWLVGGSGLGIRDSGLVRIRHGGALLSAKIKNQKSKIKVKLGEAQRGVAPGQACVFYGELQSFKASEPQSFKAAGSQGKDMVVLGGGVIR